MHRLLSMHFESTSEASSCAQETIGDAGTVGLLCTTRGGKVVAQRQTLFLRAVSLIGGMDGYNVNHEQGLVCLREAQGKNCAAAMAMLFADYPDERVRQTCFQVLRYVSLRAEGGYYATKMVVACQTLCARVCELKLVTPPENYDFVVEYGRAKTAGCLAASMFLSAALELDGRFTEAVRGYALAAKWGSAPGSFHLARCHKNGIGVEQNFGEAMQIMKQASDKKFYWAMYDRARMLQDTRCCCAVRCECTVESDSEAFELLEAVEAGVDYAYKHRGPMRCLYLQFCSVPNPHRRLAMCYETGRGVPQDSAEAQRHTALARPAN